MTQEAIVKKILENNIAEIEVVRQSACGKDCSKCEGGCSAEQQIVRAKAINEIGANVGDKVIIEGDNKKILGTAAIVYTLPIILFFVFYGIGAMFVNSQGISSAIGGIGFVVGILIGFIYNKTIKKKDEIPFVIVNNN